MLYGWTYSTNQLVDHAVPESGDRVGGAVPPVRHHLHDVVETGHLSDPLQKIDTEAVEASIAGEVLAGAHHHIRCVLQR